MQEDMSSEASVSNVIDRESIIGILWRSRHKVLRRRGIADLVGTIIIGFFVLDDYRRISHDERNSNYEKLTTIINLEAHIIWAVLAMFDLACSTGIGKYVVEVRSSIARRSKASRRVRNWRQRFVYGKSAGFGARQGQSWSIQRR